jgi:hypothetical protein
MSLHAKLPAIVIVASSLVLPFAAPESAVAETCLTAPKGQAPEGSHWYYRLERPSMRKCWRLVAKGEESGAPRTASRSPQQERRAQKAAPEIEPQGDIEDESEAAPAPAARTAPQITTLQTRPAAAPTQFAQTPFADNPAPSVSEAPLPLPPPAPSAEATPRADNRSGSLPLGQTAPADSAPAVIIEQSATQPLATPARDKAALPEGTSLLHWLPALLALLGLGGGAVFYVTRMMQRRSDVLTVLQNTDSPALAPPVEPSPMPDEPTFAPLPPIGASSREDDVEEALRRFTQNWKRRAA